MESPEQYTLLSTLGLAPAVVTELIWTYATDKAHPRVPERVILLTTAQGYARWQTDAMDSGIWERFCNEILGGMYIKPEFPPVPGVNDRLIEDIQSHDDDIQVANMIYKEVYKLTRPKCSPLVGSLAGGRKTMSAHMMAAFTVFARRNDELVHVLVARELEQDNSFYYPPRDAPPESLPIHRVNLPFAPMHAYLVRDFFGHMDTDKRDLNAMMHAIRTFEFTLPSRALIYIADGKWQSSSVVLVDTDGDPLDSFQLSRQNLCTLLVMAQHLYNQPGGASNLDLTHNKVQDQYRAVNTLFSSNKTSSAWTETDDITKAISRLNDRLKDQLKHNESALRHLSINGNRTKDETRYTWMNGKGLPIEFHGAEEVVSRAKKISWNRHFPDFPIRLEGR